MKITGPANTLSRIVELVVGLVVLCMLVLVFIIDPLGPHSRGFDNLNGVEAQSRLGKDWPPGAKPADVFCATPYVFVGSLVLWQPAQTPVREGPRINPDRMRIGDDLKKLVRPVTPVVPARKH